MMMPGSGGSRMPGLGQQPPPSTNRSSMWYRFDVDLSANPAGISVKSLIKEADKSLMKAAAAAAAAASSTARACAHPGASTATLPNGCAVTTDGAGAVTTQSAPANRVNGIPGAQGGDKTATVGTARPPSSAVGDPVSASDSANGMKVPPGETGTAERPVAKGNTSSAMEVAAPELSEPTGVKSTTEDIIRDKKRKIVGMSLIERLELKYGGQGLGIMTDSDEESSEMDSEDEPSSAEESGEGGGGGDDDGAEGGAAGDSGAKKVAKKKRRVADELDYEDDFIDDAELEKVFYAKAAASNAKTVHTGFFANQGDVETIGQTKPAGGGSKKKKSSAEGSGGGTPGGGDGDFVKKKKKKPKAASPTKAEAGKGGDTAAPAKKKSKKKPPAAGGEGAGGGGAAGAKEAGTLTTTKTSTTAVAAAAAAAPIVSTATQPSASATGDVGQSSPAAAAALPAASVAPSGTTATANVPVNTGTNSGPTSVAAVDNTSGSRGGGDGIVTTPGVCVASASTPGAQGPVAHTNGDVPGNTAAIVATATATATVPQEKAVTGVSSGNAATGAQADDVVVVERDVVGTSAAVKNSSDVAANTGGGSGTSAVAGVGAGKGGSDVKVATVDSASKMTALDPTLSAALTRFEEDSKPWVDAGRPEGDPSAAVLEELLKLDAVRQSVEAAHVPSLYIERLSDIYGKSTQEVKSILITVRTRAHKEDCQTLKVELDSLKAEFAQKVSANITVLKGAVGQQLVPPFHWTDPLRGKLHDLVRAFEAWAGKELGGLRTKQAITAIKELYEQLSQLWPAELTMTPDDVKKMYLNEKRRIRTKANKEAAAETSPATPKLSWAGGSPAEIGKDSVLKEGATRVAAAPLVTTAVSPPPSTQAPTAVGAAAASSNSNTPCSAAADTAARSHSIAPAAAEAATAAPATSTPSLIPSPPLGTSAVPGEVAAPTSASMSPSAAMASVRGIPSSHVAAVRSIPIDMVSPLRSVLSPRRATQFESPPEFNDSDFDELEDSCDEEVEEVCAAGVSYAA